MLLVNRNPSNRMLHQFGAIWTVFFGVVGVLVWRKTGVATRAVEIWAGAGGLALVGLLYPPVMRWLFVGLSYATYPIGWTLSHLILALVYYGIVTPIGVVMRWLGRDPMLREFDRSAASYWVPRRGTADTHRYFRQY
jgi:hypothetical protein